MRKVPDSKHPKMKEVIELLKIDPTLNIADLARRYDIPDATIRGRWHTVQKYAAYDANLETAFAVIRSNKPRQPVDGPVQNIVLAIPDLHCPWEHPDALMFLRAVRDKYQPNIIVNLGDEVDFYGLSRFDHDPDIINPGGELNLAVKHLIPFYREFPDVLICQSNHTHRAHAKAQKAGLPKSPMKSIEEILKTPEGWIYKHCHRIDGVDYKHGTGKSGANAHVNHSKATGRSTCIGHIHAYGGVNYLRYGVFAANFGCLIDKSAPCFDYAAEMDDNIVLGCGIVFGGKTAQFIPMLVDHENRWVGYL